MNKVVKLKHWQVKTMTNEEYTEEYFAKDDASFSCKFKCAFKILRNMIFGAAH